MRTKLTRSRSETCYKEHRTESGKIGYFILWLMGAPVGLLVILWLILGNNLFGSG